MRNQRLRSRRQRGFTILEIVIVFILLAGIMAFIGPKIFEQMGRAKSAEQRIKTQSLAGQIEMYKLEVGRYPESLQALAKQPPGVDKWNQPSRLPKASGPNSSPQPTFSMEPPSSISATSPATSFSA